MITDSIIKDKYFSSRTQFHLRVRSILQIHHERSEGLKLIVTKTFVGCLEFDFPMSVLRVGFLCAVAEVVLPTGCDGLDWLGCRATPATVRSAPEEPECETDERERDGGTARQRRAWMLVAVTDRRHHHRGEVDGIDWRPALLLAVAEQEAAHAVVAHESEDQPQWRRHQRLQPGADRVPPLLLLTALHAPACAQLGLSEHAGHRAPRTLSRWRALGLGAIAVRRVRRGHLRLRKLDAASVGCRALAISST